jgi:hypothetical protein
LRPSKFTFFEKSGIDPAEHKLQFRICVDLKIDAPVSLQFDKSSDCNDERESRALGKPVSLFL